jgi:hypothetical protein
MNSRIIVFLTAATGLIVAIFLGQAVGQGQKMHIAFVFGFMVGAPLLLSLGKNYWYLIPGSILCGLPAIPLGGRNIDLAELCIILCFSIFLARLAFKLDKVVIWRATHIPIILFIGWVCFIFCIYPVGLGVFGSSLMGGRFYFQLLLTFIVFIVISSREITGRDCKWIILFIVIGSITSAIYGITSFFLFAQEMEIANDGSGSDGFYTWHQSLAGPALAIVFLLFSWKQPQDILGFRNIPLLILYILAISLTLFSGKRTALAALFLAPIVSSIVFKQYRYIFAALIAFFVFSFVVIFGHGNAFHFPLQIQRTLSWLPAEWDTEFQYIEGGADPFRESLRRFAMENIKRDPIIGRGFSIQYSEIMSQISASKYSGGPDSLAAPAAIGRSWHNTWLGYAADFGIPLAIIQALIYLTALIVSFKTARAYPFASFQSIISIYILIYTVRDILVSNAVGHTAVDAWHRWWMYAVLFSLYAIASKTKSNIAVKSK